MFPDFLSTTNKVTIRSTGGNQSTFWCFTSVGYMPSKGIAGSEGICILVLRNCFQSDGTKAIAYCYLITSKSELFFRYLLPFSFFPSELFFQSPLPYFHWMVVLLNYESSSNIVTKSCIVLYIGAIFFHIYCFKMLFMVSFDFTVIF